MHSPSSASPRSSQGGHYHQQNNILREKVLRSNERGDWSTIDFLYDREAAEKQSVERKEKRVHDHGGLQNDVAGFFAATQAWLSAILAGLLLGFIAVGIEICTDFVVSIRIGVCANYFWLNRELCCPLGEDNCPEFFTWGEYFGGPGAPHSAIVDYFCYVGFGMFFAATAAFFCRNYSPFGAGGGINEVKTIVSGHVVKRYFGGWTILVKAVGCCMSTGSGLAIGKEGPFVHLGACCADVIGRIFPTYANESRIRELISAGGGAGVAVAFGAPIGGVLFALEELFSTFSFRAMMQAMICGVTATLVLKNFDVSHTGRIVQFSIDYQHRWHWFELPLFAMIGSFGGLAGAFYNHWNISWVKTRKTTAMAKWPITEVVILIIISNTLNFFLPFCKGGLLGLLADLYQDCPPGSELELCESNEFRLIFYLVVAGCVKCVLSLLTVGSSVPAGLLVPSLVIGALFGRAFGLMFKSLHSLHASAYYFTECYGLSLCIIPGAYAIVGSAAVLTGVTRMTVCLAVIMFELTGGLEYLVPVIIGILFSKWTAEAVGSESIYELGIEQNMLPYLDPKKEFDYSFLARDIFKNKTYTCVHNFGWTVEDLNDMLEANDYSGFPVVVSKTDLTLYGYISRKSLINAMHETAMRHAASVTPHTQVRFCEIVPGEEPTEDVLDYSRFVDGASIQVPPDCSIQRLLYIFKSLGSARVIVTRFSKFQGVITKKDLIEFMRKIEHADHHELEHIDDEEEASAPPLQGVGPQLGQTKGDAEVIAAAKTDAKVW